MRSTPEALFGPARPSLAALTAEPVRPPSTPVPPGVDEVEFAMAVRAAHRFLGARFVRDEDENQYRLLLRSEPTIGEKATYMRILLGTSGV